MITKQKPWLAGITMLACLTLISPANSQIVPDSTTKTKIVNDCLNGCNITGGILAEDNLFHSFHQFNVGAGESVYFTAPNVANIFSRVTGNHLSLISGKLGVSGGDANLFLLNPNGIIFGAGARLDVNGSFVATTANEIQFRDRGFLTATADSRENLALLTVNPSAFLFNQMGQLQPISTKPGAELKVPKQKNITLLAGQSRDDSKAIFLRGTNLQAPEGRVTLGAVREDTIVGIDPNFQLQFADDALQGDISLTQGSAIDMTGDGSGSGSIYLGGGKIDLDQNSSLVADPLGDIKAGNISIQIDNLFLETSLSGEESDRTPGGTINATTNGISASSSFVIESGSIQIINLDGIISSTLIYRPNWSPLPTTLIAVDQLVVKKCSSNINSNGVFSYVGRGGLSSNLIAESFSSENTIPDFNIPQVRSLNSQFFEPETSNGDFSLAQTISGEEAIEAQTWFRNKTGNVVLTAKGDRRNAKVNPHYCLFDAPADKS